VTWSACRQDVVALSTTEAEYIAAVNTAQTGIWATKLLRDLYLPPEKPVTIYLDSKGADSLAKQSTNFAKVRHLRTRYHWLRDAIRKKEIDLERIPGWDNPADIFTKGVPADEMCKHLKAIGIATQGEC
jgi:hypothetical protein